MKDQVIDQIEVVRQENNSLWMQLLRIALDKSPDETRKVLAQITKNDKKVADLLGMLAWKSPEE